MRGSHLRPTYRQGTALLPALLILGMVTIVVVLFFSMSTVQMRSSASQAAVHDVTTLQDMAMNNAIGQMRMGTTESKALWISQPGAIRTYIANSGLGSRVYKLYSARDMVVENSMLISASAQNLETDVPNDWDARPGTYTDLNEPALDEAGDFVFPIVDPRVMDMVSPTYPDSKVPEGFQYSQHLAVSNASINGVRLPGNTASMQRLPMPVRWIYVLQDGSIGVMDDSTSPKFTPFSGQSLASKENPIVGRYAFWTDDESAKININTASEAIFWDTPRCATNREIEFAVKPPVRNEVQRFGGHPATTCLSTVFFPGEKLVPGSTTMNQKLEQLYAITPRVNADGGIMAGNSVPVNFDTDRLYASVDELLIDDPSDISGFPLAGGKRTVQALFAQEPARVKRLRFFLTSESRAPELTAAGTPRVSIWPVSYRPEPQNNKRTSFDNVSAFASTLGKHPYHFRRSGAASNMDDFSNYYNTEANDPFGVGMIHNNHLAQYIIEGARSVKQGYAKSMTEKYDSRHASWSTSAYNMGSSLVAMLEYIRQTNGNDSTHSTKNVSPRVPVDAYTQTSANWIGTDTLGQVAAVNMTYYSAPLNTDNRSLKRNQNDEGNDRVWNTGIGREFTVSEFGLVFILAAENPASGAAPKLNPDLVSKLKLPAGVKAIQVGVVAEGFCAAQGYTMIAPSSSFNVTQLGSLRIDTAGFGARGVGGAVNALGPPPVQDTVSGEPYMGWGSLLHNVSHLQYLCKIKPKETPQSGRMSTGDWWVGWGGSGGYWMYADSDTNAHSQISSLRKSDFDTPANTLSNPAMYSRGYFLVPSNATSMTISSSRTGGVMVDRCLEIRVGNQRDGDYGDRRLMVEIPQNLVVPVPAAPAALGLTFSKRYKDVRTSGATRFGAPEIIDVNDVVRTWVVRHGDYRLPYQRLREGAGAVGVDARKRLMVPHPAWDPATISAGRLLITRTIPQIHAFTKSGGKPHKVGGPGGVSPTFGDGMTSSSLVNGVTYNSDVRPDFVIDSASATFRANVPANYPYSVNPTDTRDWDNGTGIAPDGAYWNKPDDGAQVFDGSIPPYFSQNPWDGVNINQRPANQTTAPNQLIPSPVMFGSLPSAPSTGLQWTTFLFRPDLTPGSGHLGSADHSTKGNLLGAPPDHTLLDWFWMPVVQPYPISEPFSTAGKVNMNYRIVPFTNITRATGLHAVLKSEELLAIPTNAGMTYKDYTQANANGKWRHYIDAAATLTQWEETFNQGRFFKNTGEVCEQFLVPKDQGIPSGSGTVVRNAMRNFWNNHRLTGDNTLERPYANIYPRLTTRSNTFRVHFRAQTLRKARSSDPQTFLEGKDTIIAERQGDALVERAIDPNDPALMTDDYDYINKARNGTLSSAKSLDNLYSWRIRSIRRFSR
ncbi:uncharacterized protein (TIGR02600 family) [Roseimicrobium gellanilyticum]|uniref:Uncharacterized protein (TIGR02600 family) n=1 Tax=Roseimicrobium gellanilyticum TaxID=748857 RepID=A0A366HLK7_9BACT|nr:Verru_Chthon cassette protein A [Roseimicrobium gellanilyticum]RBP42643.1 uncharacterized protein (TIGR02600 family) [Roseimicrobium gellanilyticum]